MRHQERYGIQIRFNLLHDLFRRSLDDPLNGWKPATRGQGFSPIHQYHFMPQEGRELCHREGIITCSEKEQL